MATEKKITSRIQQKHDVAANWAKATNFIPKKGEIIIYDAEYNASGEETQSVRFKIGDGSKTVNNLPFAVIDYSSDVEALKRKVANNSTAIGVLQENTVPKTRKINNKALSSDITLGAADVGVNETTFPGLKKTGTVTGVKMNGTTKTPSSGVVDIGTVITDVSDKQNKITSSNKLSASLVSGLATVATSGSYDDLANTQSVVTTDTVQTINSKKTFNGEVKFGNTENFQGYYIKRMIGSLGAGTAYDNLDSLYKDGTYHRMWRLRFPKDSFFWGKIKITLYGGYSSFNASGVMSKSITCNFNTSSIYNNVGCYDGLGVNVEQDFRISEAIWNATASAWEILIWQKNLNGNNSPVIMLECWTTNILNYANAFNGITAQPVELTQSTSYSAQRASSTGGTKTVEWATLPVYENPLGEEIATVAMLEDKYALKTDIPTIPTVNDGTLTIQKNGETVGIFTANQSTNTTANITVPTKTSELTNDSGYLTSHQDISGKANLDGGNTFTGKQILNSPASDGCSINAAGYVKGYWLQSGTKSNYGSGTGMVCVFGDNGRIYYRTPDEILREAGGAKVSDIPNATRHSYTQLTNEDLNVITEAGWYRAASDNTCTNRPSEISSTIPFVLIVEKVDSYIKQTLYRINTSDQTYYLSYVRYSFNVGYSWQTWIKQQTMSDSRVQSFSGRKTFTGGINISGSPLQFGGNSGSSSQFAMSRGSASEPKWVNLQVKVNGTTYTADSSGLIDLGTISGGGSTTTYNSIGNNIY